MLIENRRQLDGLGLSLSDLLKNPAVTGGAGLAIGAAAGYFGSKYSDQIGATLKSVVSAPVTWYNQYRAADLARREAERAQYGGHQISFFTEKGLRPGDMEGLKRWNAAKKLAEQGKSPADAFKGFEWSSLLGKTGSTGSSSKAPKTSGIPGMPSGIPSGMDFPSFGSEPVSFGAEAPAAGGISMPLLIGGAALAVLLLSRSGKR